MHVAVFGVGGVGGYFGGRLAEAGEQVTFIARGQHLRAIQENGLRVDSVKGDFHIYPARAVENPQESGAVDVVLLGVKAWQVPEAAEALRLLIGAGTCVVPLQNGVEAPTQLAAVLGSAHVLGGMCKISAYIAAPGHIRHVGIEPYIAFGELDNRSSARVERLREALGRAGVNAEIPGDIHATMWEKFLFIAAISGVGAVTRAPIGVVREQPGTRQMIIAAMHEIEAVARAHGVGLSKDVVTRSMAFVDSLPPSVTASMQRDIMAGLPSELASQNGAVVRLGRAVDVPTPVNAFLYHSLLAQERRARGELDF